MPQYPHQTRPENPDLWNTDADRNQARELHLSVPSNALRKRRSFEADIDEEAEDSPRKKSPQRDIESGVDHVLLSLKREHEQKEQKAIMEGRRKKRIFFRCCWCNENVPLSSIRLCGLCRHPFCFCCTRLDGETDDDETSDVDSALAADLLVDDTA